jgi:hypothetical protein
MMERSCAAAGVTCAPPSSRRAAGGATTESSSVATGHGVDGGEAHAVEPSCARGRYAIRHVDCPITEFRIARPARIDYYATGAIASTSKP